MILTLRRPYNALVWFDITFELLMGSAKHYGGYGLSICLGDLNTTEPFGEEGAGMGLRVLFKTWRTPSPPHETIEVWYANEALLVVDTGKSLRTASWVPMHVRHDENGLHVTHNGKQWIDSYKIRDWDPLASWRLGFGARGASTIDDHAWGRSEDYPTSPERHWIENLTISSGLLIAEATAPVSLSFNGQQYNPVPLEFDYYAMPSVSSVTPTTGPLAGGTLVTIYGSKLDAGLVATSSGEGAAAADDLMAHTNSHLLGYRCRFNKAPYYDVQVGSEVFGAKTVQAHDLAMRHPANIMEVDPPRNACYVGPDQLLPNLAYADSDCLYGSQVVNATYNEQIMLRTYGGETEAGTLTCVTPPRHNARTSELEISLNGEQYTKDKLPFVFYDEIIQHSLWPLGGPQHGGTIMFINASNLHNGSDFRCRFFWGEEPWTHRDEHARSCCAIGETRATFEDLYIWPDPQEATSGLIKCVSPPLPETLHRNYSYSKDGNSEYPLAYNATLHVTKNGQNYDILGLPFAIYRKPVPDHHDPPGGPRKGNTTVTLYGSYSGGFTKYCRFGMVGQVPATLRYDPERLICMSPDSQNTSLPDTNTSHEHPVPLDVSLNGQQYDNVGVYHYYDDPSWSYIRPPAGPTRGGTQCTLRARGLAANIQPGLDGHHQYFCMYGRHGRVQASYVAHETLRCDSPPAMELMDNGPRTITVSVTTNDQDYHPAAEFQYYEEPIISSILPNTGPIFGGTAV